MFEYILDMGNYIQKEPNRVECSPVQETGVQSQIESYQRLKKCYLITSR